MALRPAGRSSRRFRVLVVLLLVILGGAGGAGGASAQEVTVDGVIESTGGGLKFPDGTIQDSATGSYANVVFVAQSGGDFTSIQAALDSITDAMAGNRYLVRVAPGVYDEQVTMKQDVDVAGAGVEMTRIRSGGFASPDPLPDTGTVVCAADSELRDLTVENTGGDTFAVGIYCAADARLLRLGVESSDGVLTFGILNENASPTLIEVSVTASTTCCTINGVRNTNTSAVHRDVQVSTSGGTFNTGIYNLSGSPWFSGVIVTAMDGSVRNRAVDNAAATPTFDDLIATASGAGADNTGVYNDRSSPTFRRSRIEATGSNSYGIYNDDPFAFGGHTVKINHSVIIGATNTVRNDPLFTTLIGFSRLDGGPVDSNGGTVICGAVYDENFDPFASTCP